MNGRERMCECSVACANNALTEEKKKRGDATWYCLLVFMDQTCCSESSFSIHMCPMVCSSKIVFLGGLLRFGYGLWKKMTVLLRSTPQFFLLSNTAHSVKTIGQVYNHVFWLEKYDQPLLLIRYKIVALIDDYLHRWYVRYNFQLYLSTKSLIWSNTTVLLD